MIEWAEFANTCVTSSNGNLLGTNHPAGGPSIDDCKSECLAKQQCSAIEWRPLNVGPTRCDLHLSAEPATTGSFEANPDVQCYIKPSGGKTSTNFVLLN